MVAGGFDSLGSRPRSRHAEFQDPFRHRPMFIEILPPLQDAAEATASGLELSWIDWVGLGLAGLFMLLGIFRGLWWQVIRLLGLVGSVALARTFSAPWGALLEEQSDLSSEVATGIVWVGLFLIGIILTAVLGTLGKRSLEAMQLGLVDRFGGLMAGLATGALLHVAWLVVLAHLGPQPWTADRLEGTYSRGLLQAVTTRYPVLTQRETHAADNMIQWLGTEPKAPAKGGLTPNQFAPNKKKNKNGKNKKSPAVESPQTKVK